MLAAPGNCNGPFAGGSLVSSELCCFMLLLHPASCCFMLLHAASPCFARAVGDEMWI